MAWGNWTNLGIAESISPPTVAASPKGSPFVTCFTVTSAGDVLAVDVDPYPFMPGKVPPPLPSQIISGVVSPGSGAVISPRSPGAIQDHDGNVNIFAISTDSVLRLNLNGGNTWRSLDPEWTHGVSALSRTGMVECFTVGTNSKLYHRVGKTRQGGPPDWDDWAELGLGGELTSAPAAVSWGPGRNDVFALDLNGKVQHTYWINGDGWRGAPQYPQLRVASV